MKKLLMACILCLSTTLFPADNVVTAINYAAQTALQPFVNSSQLLADTQTLETYNQKHFWQPIPIERVKIFLDEQVIAVGLNPKNITYVVGQEWKLLKKDANTYVLIIPDTQPTLTEFYKTFTGGQAAPAYTWNIESIAKLIRNRDAFSPLDYDTCRLTTRKTLIEPFTQSVTELSLRFLEYVTSIILNAATTVPSKVNPYYVLIADQLMAQIRTLQLEKSLELALDGYVIYARDIGLLKARIKELEDVIASRSLVGKSVAWIQKNSTPTESQTVENRLTVLKSFLEQHKKELENSPVTDDLEIRLYKKIMHKNISH